jgi:hypothetical protein
LGKYYSASADAHAEPFTVSEPDIAILVANCIDNTIRIAISDICISDSEPEQYYVGKSNPRQWSVAPPSPPLIRTRINLLRGKVIREVSNSVPEEIDLLVYA